MIRQIINKLLAKILVRGAGSENINNVFNSIRINALVNQLCEEGIIDKSKYEANVEDEVFNILRRNKDDGRRL